ncbi:hypothetical protein Q8G40_30655, partial [Klebsiella pneumoniae]|uniref:hypothetical protein n=1 Tax=Klebsiella pneumoniae TaxID=573 RepID=UPI003013918C
AKMKACLSRRKLLASILFSAARPVLAAVPPKPKLFDFAPVNSGLNPDDDHFLNDLEYACFEFFWEQMNPLTGLVKDRA